MKTEIIKVIESLRLGEHEKAEKYVWQLKHNAEKASCSDEKQFAERVSDAFYGVPVDPEKAVCLDADKKSLPKLNREVPRSEMKKHIKEYPTKIRKKCINNAEKGIKSTFFYEDIEEGGRVIAYSTEVQTCWICDSVLKYAISEKDWVESAKEIRDERTVDSPSHKTSQESIIAHNKKGVGTDICFDVLKELKKARGRFTCNGGDLEFTLINNIHESDEFMKKEIVSIIESIKSVYEPDNSIVKDRIRVTNAIACLSEMILENSDVIGQSEFQDCMAILRRWQEKLFEAEKLLTKPLPSDYILGRIKRVTDELGSFFLPDTDESVISEDVLHNLCVAKNLTREACNGGVLIRKIDKNNATVKKGEKQ